MSYRGFRLVISRFAVHAYCMGFTVVSQAQSPIYFFTFPDAVTGDNACMIGGSRYWDVDAGADVYQYDQYERPTIQGFALHGARYSTHEYFEYLDITHAQ